MKCAYVKYRITFKDAVGDGCDWMSGLLTEQGMYSPFPLLLDWSYDHCGGEVVQPDEVEEGVWGADVWLLLLPGKTLDAVNRLLQDGVGVVKVEMTVPPTEIEIEEYDQYEEGSFLAQVDDSRDTVPGWVDRHSVNCAKCAELVDERTCVPGPGGEGDICPKCQ